jgi:tetratricopeptide (TPR) repeat protein
MRADCSLHVFVATPRDVAAERDRLGLIVRDLSAAFAAHGLTLELLDWRDVVPDLGRPEDVILDQLPVDRWDIFIGVLWARFGTPPGRKDPGTGKPFLSGTEEEFKLACYSSQKTGKPRILFYRCKRPVPVDWLDPEQIALVQGFFTGFGADGEYPGLYKEYKTVDDFERRVRQDLLKLLLEYSQGEKQATLENEVGAEVRKLEEERRQREEKEEKTEAGEKVEAQVPLTPRVPQLILPPDPDTLYTEALEHFYLGEYAEAMPVFEAVLKAQSDYPGAKEKLEIVRLTIDELPRLRKEGNWREMLRKVAQLRELEPDYADPEGHATWAEERRRVNELYPQGIKAMGAKRWAEVVLAFQEIVEIDRDYRRAQALLEQARDRYRRSFKKWQKARRLGGHLGSVLSVTLSPDGSLLASGSYDKTVRLWEIDTGREMRCLEGHTGYVYGVVFSPDGSLLASGSYDTTVRLWEVETGREVCLLKGHTGYVYGVAFSPDGSLLASASGDNTVRLWEVETGRAWRRLEGHTGYVSSVAFSPDGSLLASASQDNTVRLWEIDTGREVHRLERHTGSVGSVAFSPDGVLLASGSEDRTVRLWEVETGWEVRLLKGHTGSVGSVAFSPDGSLLASGSADNTVCLWGAR